jgi:hypothetical protein
MTASFVTETVSFQFVFGIQSRYSTLIGLQPVIVGSKIQSTMARISAKSRHNPQLPQREQKFHFDSNMLVSSIAIDLKPDFPFAPASTAGVHPARPTVVLNLACTVTLCGERHGTRFVKDGSPHA